MSVINYLRRRVFGKSASIIKRVVLPAGAVLVLLQLLVFRDRPAPQQEDFANLIIPGEALDPVLEKRVGGAHSPPYVTAHHAHPTHEDASSHTSSSSSPRPSPSPVKRKQQEESKAPDVKGDDSSKQQQQKKQQQKQQTSSWSMASANITDSHKVRFKGHAITNQTVTLTLMSSQDKVFMSLNKKEIYRNLGDRGIHLVVLNQHSGQVMARQVFDTFSVGVEEDMVAFIDDVRDGRILVFAVLDEASDNLSWRGRNKLKDLGSRWADKLAYRDMWALVTRKGGLKMAETYSNVATADTGYEWGGPVFLRTDFDLEEGKGECKWPYNERNEARRVFCQRYDGYGALCDCDVTSWSAVFFHADEELHKQLSQAQLHKDLGVVILATNRPHYLYRTLKALWEAPGLNRDKVAVYSDGHHRETTALARLFGVHLVVDSPKGNTTKERIRHKVQRVFRDVMGAKFPPESVPEGGLPEDTIAPFTCSHLLLLEDDIQVSVDAFKFLHALAPALDHDHSILGISSFNYFGYTDVANSLTAVYRTSQNNPMALMLPARTIHDYMVPRWPARNTTKEWYRPLRYPLNELKDGALLYPEVPRARHVGYRGEVIEGSVQHNYFRDHILALTTDYEIPEAEVLKLSAEQYEARLQHTLKESDPITFDFCKHDLLYGENPLVMFVSYNGSRNDEDNFNYVMKCLRTWDLYPEAGWHGVWQFHYHGHLLSIVAVPMSPYSHLKPEKYTVITAPPTTTTTTPSTSTTSSSAPPVA